PVVVVRDGNHTGPGIAADRRVPRRGKRGLEPIDNELDGVWPLGWVGQIAAGQGEVAFLGGECSPHLLPHTRSPRPMAEGSCTLQGGGKSAHEAAQHMRPTGHPGARKSCDASIHPSMVTVGAARRHTFSTSVVGVIYPPKPKPGDRVAVLSPSAGAPALF